MQALPLRLSPGDDLRETLAAALARHGVQAAFVVQGIGSLSAVELRYAGVDTPASLRGDFEILTLAGSLSRDGAHLHASVSDAQGRVLGGHVAHGCIVRTTAEVLLMLLPDYVFTREHDAQTGFMELVARKS
ncbi:PPC domain-containing DNA-binding protein [Paraburkholderia sp. Ac-20347]|uniref:PPC domain-containing DNA-binding protein n=1 Tax=Paraburkholderia sp. Ac-20347 TaxID=2703892 RepID=UPI00198245DB|nr:PPC domain-containing DNA-binding protein [Paraburkholderia sp. Ac-20347]MBN3808322.1 DNA-binding protein [Paraburkholderia sp. Ac-20347]